MHTEHLQNVRPGRVLAGWLVAIAVTSVAVFGFILLGLMGEGAGRDTAWAMSAVAVGFLVGGWFTGSITLEAPILHGVALGLTSLVAWAALNLVMVVVFRGLEWEGLAATATASVILTQIVAAVVGCWVGVRGARARATRLVETPTAGARDPKSRPD
jgi:MFS family permease